MHTFAFVDIVGFTAYTARWGDEEAARLAVGAGNRIRALLPEHGAEEVKALGDGMMIRTHDPRSALRLLARLRDDADAGRLPRVRIGVETGPAVRVDGDWYGATVNRAARLCEAARPGEILAGDGLRHAAGPLPEVAFRRRLIPRPRRALGLTAYAAAPLRPVPAEGAARSLRRLRAIACPRHALERAA